MENIKLIIKALKRLNKEELKTFKKRLITLIILIIIEIIILSLSGKINIDVISVSIVTSLIYDVCSYTVHEFLDTTKVLREKEQQRVENKEN